MNINVCYSYYFGVQDLMVYVFLFSLQLPIILLITVSMLFMSLLIPSSELQ